LSRKISFFSKEGKSKRLHHYEVILGLIRAVCTSLTMKNRINSQCFLVEPVLVNVVKRMMVDLYCCGFGVQHGGLETSRLRRGINLF